MDNVYNLKDKLLGCLYGQAVGDALGLGSEFMSKQQVLRHYPSGLRTYDQFIKDAHRSMCENGSWTDDTDMMLCIMSAFEDGKFNINNVARNFKDWSDSSPWDIGSHTAKVLGMTDYVTDPEMCSKLWWNLSQQQSAANGALMRTSVVGLAPVNVVEQTEAICKLTHYDPRCVGSCVIAASIINNLVWNDRALTYDEVRAIVGIYDNRILEWVDLAYTNPDISALDLDETYSIGYTLRTLAAALWVFWHASSFENGLLAVVNEGGDADTNGAIACAILGAKFGYSSIPSYYVENLCNRELYHRKIESFINQLNFRL